MLSLFSSDLAIDLGTANTCVYARGKGIVVNEPSIVAINKVNGRVEAVGKDAKDMLGRTPGNIVAIKPMKDGVIADFEVTEKMLTYFIKKAHNRNVWVRPRIVIGVPSEITQVEKRAVKDSAYRAKASEVHLVEEAMAAAIGAGMPITEPSGNMIVDIGGGTTDIAVISLAGIVYSKAVRVAGNEMDEAIIQYIKKTYNLLIGERTAEQIKMEIGSAFPLEERMTMEIKGRHLIEGVPKTITISDEEIREALAETVNVIVDAVRVALERTPPELSADIVDRGIVLTGGGSLLKNLDKRLREETGLPLAMAEDPLSSVVLGAGQDAVGLQPAAEDFDRLRHAVVAVLDIRQRAGYLFLAVIARPRHPDLRPGQFAQRRAGARGRDLRRVRRGAARRRRPACRASARVLERLRRPARRATRRTTQLKRQLGGRAGRSCRSSARWPTAARGLEQLLDLRDRLEAEDDGRRDHRRRRDARFPDADDRQGHAARPADRHGRHRARRRRRPRSSCRARARRRCSCSIDRNAAAGALVERSRAQGVVVGAGDEPPAAGVRVRGGRRRVGDLVVTSGIDGIFPKGFVIGRVERSRRRGRPTSGSPCSRRSISPRSKRCWSC